MAFNQFQKLVLNRYRFRVFLLIKLPAALLAGVRVKKLDERQAVVSVPFGWLTQNPFKSIYFASQAMAAELSTGLLASGHLYKKQPPVSMLVTKLEAVFMKKAIAKIYFTCRDGESIAAAIREAISTGEPRVVTATSIGTNTAGEVVSEFKIEWSFRVKDR